MNTVLKSMVQLVFDGVTVGQDIYRRTNVVLMISPLVKFAEDAFSVFSNIGDLPAELAALPGEAQQQDMLSYTQSAFKGIVSAKAQAILTPALAIVESLGTNGVLLVKAIQS